uniref:Uncharacterized protein n=1 Tax=Rhizophora mucronata TaxID=61149 RepID=A0A2P2JYI8_RHIMU
MMTISFFDVLHLIWSPAELPLHRLGLNHLLLAHNILQHHQGKI